MGLVQEGLAEAPDLAAPLGLCHSTGHLSYWHLSLDQEHLHLALQGPAEWASGNAEGIRRGEGAPLGEKGTGKAWQLAQRSRLGGGRMPQGQAERPLRHWAAVICTPRRRWLHYRGCNPLFLFASQALLPS